MKQYRLKKDAVPFFKEKPAVKDYFDSLNELHDSLHNEPKLYSYAKALDDYINELLNSQNEPVIDWEGLEKVFYDECCSKRLLWNGSPATNINTKEIINWFKNNIHNYIK